MIGIAISQLSRPAGIVLAGVGAVRTLYTHVVGKGREVTFLADTPFRVRLAQAVATTVTRQHPWLVLGLLCLPVAVGGQEPQFRTDTHLVVVHPTVRDPRGALVTTLNREAFTIFENGKRQPIAVFQRDDQPVSLGLLIDNSGSMRTIRPQVEAAALALARASNPDDGCSCSTSTTRRASTCRSRATRACSRRACGAPMR